MFILQFCIFNPRRSIKCNELIIDTLAPVSASPSTSVSSIDTVKWGQRRKQVWIKYVWLNCENGLGGTILILGEIEGDRFPKNSLSTRFLTLLRTQVECRAAVGIERLWFLAAHICDKRQLFSCHIPSTSVPLFDNSSTTDWSG